MSEAVYIREASVRYHGQPRRADKLGDPGAVARFCRKVCRDDAREQFVAIYLDSRHMPIAWQLTSIGTANQSLVHPREVYQPAVMLGAAAVIVAHNHPSGDPTPSREDHDVTRRLAKAGEVLGITLLDHVIWSRTDDHSSFARSGWLESTPAPPLRFDRS